MPRPRLDPEKKRGLPVQLRLSGRERTAFDQLVAALADESPAGEMTDAGAVRVAVIEAMGKRGIAWPRGTPPALVPDAPSTVPEREVVLDELAAEAPAKPERRRPSKR